MGWLPGATPKPIAHHLKKGMMVKPIRGLVVHITDGQVIDDDQKDLQSLWGFFNTANQPPPERSAHFGIGRHGEIWQFADTNDVTFAVDGVWGGDGVDNHWVSVENIATITHKGKNNSLQELTDDQIRTLAVLLDWLHNNESVPYRLANSKADKGLGYHRMFLKNPQSHPCPGDKVIAQRQAILNLTECGLSL
jgi:hypothetical protein